jgi:hypothetical protein
MVQPATLRQRNELAALPRHPARPFAPRVCELYRHGNLRILAHRRQHGLQCSLSGIIPQSQVAGRDAAIRLDRRSLNAQHSCAGMGETAEVDQVPGVGLPVLSHVLAHRRHDDPI